MKILDGKFELVGTNGQTPVWDPIGKEHLNLLKIDEKKAGSLVIQGFPFIQVSAPSTDDSKENLQGLTKAKLLELAKEKGVEEAGLSTMTKAEIIGLLGA